MLSVLIGSHLVYLRMYRMTNRKCLINIKCYDIRIHTRLFYVMVFQPSDICRNECSVYQLAFAPQTKMHCGRFLSHAPLGQ